jgi:hypothetical protein
MRELFGKIKNMLNKPGVSRPDFWIIATMGLMLVAVVSNKIGFALMAALPALVAGFYLSYEDAPEPDDDDGDDDFEARWPEPDADLRANYDLKA